MLRRGFLALAFAGLVAGCGSTPVGKEFQIKATGNPDGTMWLCRDEQALRAFGKPPAEFDKLFNGLVTDKRIFKAAVGTRLRVLETKNIGAKAAHAEVLGGPNRGEKVWVLQAELEPVPGS
ncbi:MAG: hypothetical protein JWN86_2671 [Planctomycetota bacterium]|nr:hypothetical protein [Planctomycetota bacterium]